MFRVENHLGLYYTFSMREFQQRRFINRLLRSKLMLVAGAALIVLLANGTFGVYGKYRESLTRRVAIERELALLKARADTLSHEVERLNTPQGVEEEIRRQFNMVKEGEEVAIIVDPPNSEPASKGNEDGWWHTVLRFFGIE